MATDAICTGCGFEHKYSAKRGARIAQMHCVRCGRLGTLARSGRYPSAAARAARTAKGGEGGRRPPTPRLRFALSEGIESRLASAIKKVDRALSPKRGRAHG
jgi:hypothetical protein